MSESSDKEAALVLGFGLKPNTLAASVVGAGENRLGIYAQIDLLILDLDEALRSGTLPVLIPDMAVVGVGFLYV